MLIITLFEHNLKYPYTINLDIALFTIASTFWKFMYKITFLKTVFLFVTFACCINMMLSMSIFLKNTNDTAEIELCTANTNQAIRCV